MPPLAVPFAVQSIFIMVVVGLAEVNTVLLFNRSREFVIAYLAPPRLRTSVSCFGVLNAVWAVIFSCSVGMVMPAEVSVIPDDLVVGSQRTGISVGSDSLTPDFLCTAIWQHIQQFGNLAALELLLGSGSLCL